MIADLINLLEAQSFTCGSNIHVEQAPDSATLPYIVLVLENTDYNKTLDTTGGLIFSDLRIECVGKTISQAETLANEVETFIGDYSGTMGSRTCLAVLLDDREIDIEAAQSGEQGGRTIVTLDLQIQHS